MDENSAGVNEEAPRDGVNPEEGEGQGKDVRHANEEDVRGMRLAHEAVQPLSNPVGVRTHGKFSDRLNVEQMARQAGKVFYLYLVETLKDEYDKRNLGWPFDEKTIIRQHIAQALKSAGRSRYRPHQGKKETQRRRRQ